MTWLVDLTNYLRTQNLPGLGQNVFVYTLLQNDIGAFLTSHTAGVLANNDIPDYYKGPLQVIVRASAIQDAEAQAQSISDCLSSNVRRKAGQALGLSLPTIQVNYIYPRHAPVVYPRSDGNFYEASVNFDICFVAVSA